MWGYSKENGPAKWVESFPIAGGKCQSPIDIAEDSVEVDEKLSKVCTYYDPITLQDLSNTGASWKAQVQSGKSSLKNGPLSGDEYVLEQFHSHWGKGNTTGSEHTVNGKMYPAELHLVHWNKSKFSSFSEAAAKPGGLAVLGIFLDVGEENAELKKISQLLPFIRFKGQSITLTQTFQPENVLPEDKTYWTYSGSLTTPPCFESVTWIVFEHPIQVSEEQLAAFRNLKTFHPTESCPGDELSGCMIENYRPPCPLNERTVRCYKDSRMEE